MEELNQELAKLKASVVDCMIAIDQCVASSNKTRDALESLMFGYKKAIDDLAADDEALKPSVPLPEGVEPNTPF